MSLERQRLYRVTATTIRKSSINDPAGLAVRDGLVNNLGFDEVDSVRIGGYFEFEVKASTKNEAKKIGQEIAKMPFVSNPVMDDVDISVTLMRSRKKHQ